MTIGAYPVGSYPIGSGSSHLSGGGSLFLVPRVIFVVSPDSRIERVNTETRVFIVQGGA